MRRRRSGFTVFELVVVILLLVLLVGGGMMWMRVSQLNTWAVNTDKWLTNELFAWINNNTFNGGGNPDGDKPPAPPDGLN